MTKLKPEIKEKWVKDLRENSHLQGKKRLKDSVEGLEDKFCCLGRLCVLHGKEWDENGYYLGYDDLPPQEVINWAFIGKEVSLKGLEDPEGFKRAISKFDEDTNEEGSVVESLATANDSGATFEEIADIIEKYL